MSAVRNFPQGVNVMGRRAGRDRKMKGGWSRDAKELNLLTDGQAAEFWRLKHLSTTQEPKYLPPYNDYFFSVDSPRSVRGLEQQSSGPPGLAPPCEELSESPDLLEAQKKLLVQVLGDAFASELGLAPRNEPVNPAHTNASAPRDGPAIATRKGSGLNVAAESQTTNQEHAASVMTNVAPPPGLEHMCYEGMPPPGVFIESAQPKIDHQILPSRADLGQEKALASPKKIKPTSNFSVHCGDVTTLMIRNVPCRITQQYMMEFIDGHGFKNKYDFFYMPPATRSLKTGGSNLGYGFINFDSSVDADAFAKKFQNYQFANSSSEKLISITPARLQGRLANVDRFRRPWGLAVKLSSHMPFIRREAAEVAVEKDDVSLSCSTTPPSSMENIDLIFDVPTTLEHIEVIDDPSAFDLIFE